MVGSKPDKALFSLILYDSINYINIAELSASHLSHATAIFVVDYCQFVPTWMIELKMKLMVCANLVGDTTEQGFLFPDLTWYYK